MRDSDSSFVYENTPEGVSRAVHCALKCARVWGDIEIIAIKLHHQTQEDITHLF